MLYQDELSSSHCEKNGDYRSVVISVQIHDNIIVRVRVTAEPGLPYIRQATDADVVEVVEGEPVVLDCVSPGAR